MVSLQFVSTGSQLVLTVACLTGVHTTVFFSCVYFVVFVNRRSRYTWLHLAYISMLFVMGTVNLAANTKSSEMTWIEGHKAPGGPNAWYASHYSTSVNIAGCAAFMVANCLTNALLVSTLAQKNKSFSDNPPAGSRMGGVEIHVARRLPTRSHLHGLNRYVQRAARLPHHYYSSPCHSLVRRDAIPLRPAQREPLVRLHRCSHARVLVHLPRAQQHPHRSHRRAPRVLHAAAPRHPRPRPRLDVHVCRRAAARVRRPVHARRARLRRRICAAEQGAVRRVPRPRAGHGACAVLWLAAVWLTETWLWEQCISPELIMLRVSLHRACTRDTGCETLTTDRPSTPHWAGRKSAALDSIQRPSQVFHPTLSEGECSVYSLDFTLA